MKRLLFLYLIIAPFQVFASEDLYPFSNQIEQQRFSTLTHNLRCLVCQNQNLNDSNAPLANDLKNQVYEQIIQGESDEKIIEYLVTRYGDFILYKPPLTKTTILLWLGPILFLIITITYLIFYLKSVKSIKMRS